MLVLLLFFFLASILILVNTSAFRTKYNYANAFILIWCFCAGISGLGLYGFYVPPAEAYVYIFLMLLCFELITLLSKKVRVSIRTTKKRNNTVISWRFINLVSVACIAIMLPTMLLSLRTLASDGMNMVRAMMLGNSLISTAQSLLLERIIQPIIIANVVITILDFIENKRVRVILPLSIISVVIFTAIYMNRWLVMETLYIIVTIMLIKYSTRISRMVKENKKIVLIGVFLISIMAYVTSQRQIRGSKGLLYNVYSYFIGSIHLFGVAIKESDLFLLHNSDNLLYGGVLFSAILGIIDLIFLLVKGINSPIIPGGTIINEVVQKYYYVSPTTHMNNNVTMLYGFLRDGDIFGIILDTTILALFYAHLYKRQEDNFFRKCMYIFALSIFPSLIFEWMLGRSYIILVFVVLWGYEKIFTKSERSY